MPTISQDRFQRRTGRSPADFRPSRLDCLPAGDLKPRPKPPAAIRYTARMLTDAGTVAAALAELKALLGTRASDAAAVRDHHSHGESYHPPAAPDIVCFPATTDEVVGDRRASAQRLQLPIVPFGAGTSLEGHVHAIHGGITVDLREMNRVLRVSAEDLDATVEAGVTRLQLAQGAAQHRPDVPDRSRRRRDDRRHGRDARVGHDGGPLRHDARERARADGRARRRPRDHDRHARAQVVRRLRPDAPVRRVGRHARHHHRGDAAAASGARGGVGGGLRVRDDAGRGRHGDRDDSARRPGRAHRAARRRADGCDQPLLEDRATRSRRRCSSSSTATASAHVAEPGARRCEALAAEHGGHGFEWATRLEDRERLWQARHDALLRRRSRCGPAARAWTTDVCVPISRLADCVVETEDGQPRRVVPDLPRRPRRRRQLPSASTCVDPGRPGGGRRRRAGSTSGWCCGRWRWAARAPASTASATAR